MTKTFVADEILTAADTNAYLRNRLYKMTPTSVTGTGVSIGSTGDILATAATAANINGVFTSDFRNYLVLVTIHTRSTASFNTLLLRAAGVNLTTGYDLVRTIRAGTVTTAQLTNNSDIPLGSGNFASNFYRVELFDPQATQQTRIMSRNVESQAAAAATITEVDGSTRATTAYDGFALTASSGTWTGYVQVFGYW